MSIKLTDTQLIMLSAAAQRNDRCLVAAPNLKVAAAQKIASKLIGAGLVKEIRAKAGAPVWRRDDEAGLSYALKLTAAGAKAIAIDESAEPGHVDDDGDLREDVAPTRSSSREHSAPDPSSAGRERDCAPALLRSARRDEAGAGRRTASAGSRREHRRVDRGDGVASAHDTRSADWPAQARLRDGNRSV